MNPVLPSSESAASGLPLDAEGQLRLRRALGALAVLGGASLLGVAFSPYLVTHWPLLLVALSPLGRHLVLAAPVVSPGAFLAVAIGRRLVFYLACFELGRVLGPWAIPWVEARSVRFGRFVRWVEQLFARAPRTATLLFAGPTVSVLAGASSLRWRSFTVLAALNLAVRVTLVLGFAEWMRGYLETLLAWIEAWWLPATGLTLVAVLAYQLVRRWTRSPEPASHSAV